MYNPQNLHECEVEKKRNPRRVVDTLMTGIGGVASVSSIPQVIKIWETGDVSGISLTTQMLALGAVVAWFFYGLYIQNKPLAITSALSTIVVGTVVVQIFFYS
ncbi:MAG: PQ-loop domain-containing transporter [Candidatus Campbellbacteria bacterium]|nr:PQ-loop domain-containing transporter [Candidatus Campbellbacteria bacterium]